MNEPGSPSAALTTTAARLDRRTRWRRRLPTYAGREARAAAAADAGRRDQVDDALAGAEHARGVEPRPPPCSTVVVERDDGLRIENARDQHHAAHCSHGRGRARPGHKSGRGRREPVE